MGIEPAGMDLPDIDAGLVPLAGLVAAGMAQVGMAMFFR
jgi:hypothetical protein